MIMIVLMIMVVGGHGKGVFNRIIMTVALTTNSIQEQEEEEDMLLGYSKTPQTKVRMTGC